MQPSRGVEEILKDEFIDANRERCINASREMYTVLATHTNSEASAIVRTVTGLDGVKVWRKLYENESRRTLGRLFWVQRECMYPKPAKVVSQVSWRSSCGKRSGEP